MKIAPKTNTVQRLLTSPQSEHLIERDSEINSFKDNVKGQDEEIQTLERSMATADIEHKDQLDAKEQANSKLHSELASGNAIIQNKDGEIQTLRDDLKMIQRELSEQLTAHEEEVSKERLEVEEIRSSMKEKDKQIQQFKDTASAKENGLQEELAQLRIKTRDDKKRADAEKDALRELIGIWREEVKATPEVEKFTGTADTRTETGVTIISSASLILFHWQARVCPSSTEGSPAKGGSKRAVSVPLSGEPEEPEERLQVQSPTRGLYRGRGSLSSIPSNSNRPSILPDGLSPFTSLPAPQQPQPQPQAGSSTQQIVPTTVGQL
ncbi:MAG: hypothetical protein Q9170_004643 [Blastenia crenularia]